MKIAVRAVAVTFLAAGTACSHLPGYQGPAYDFRKNAVPAEPGRKVETGQLPPGTYWALVSESWADRMQTGFSFLALFKPADPDQLTGPSKVRSGARNLPAENGRVSDRVDYSGMKRTNWWRIDTPAEGTLKIGFEPQGQAVVAEIEGTGSTPEQIGPYGYEKEDIAAGQYY